VLQRVPEIIEVAALSFDDERRRKRVRQARGYERWVKPAAESAGRLLPSDSSALLFPGLLGATQDTCVPRAAACGTPLLGEAEAAFAVGVRRSEGWVRGSQMGLKGRACDGARTRTGPPATERTARSHCLAREQHAASLLRLALSHLAVHHATPPPAWRAGKASEEPWPECEPALATPADPLGPSPPFRSRPTEGVAAGHDCLAPLGTRDGGRSCPVAARSRLSNRFIAFLMVFPSVGSPGTRDGGSCGSTNTGTLHTR
jgi:hypothetical protein